MSSIPMGSRLGTRITFVMGIIPPSVGLLGTRMRFKIDSRKSDFVGTHPQRILLVVYSERSYNRAVPPLLENYSHATTYHSYSFLKPR